MNITIQQFIALVFVLFFIARLWQQKRLKQINSSEFSFWFVFWLLAALAILFLRRIDALVGNFGFSASGIEVLLYLAVVMLFYFIFRMRIRLARLEREITKLVQALAIFNNKKE
ncbi:MAG: DUF2304 domain-containing protein [bacterium]|nr:DUF2304 domain-containing protein [bacterium]